MMMLIAEHLERTQALRQDIGIRCGLCDIGLASCLLLVYGVDFGAIRGNHANT